MSVNPRASLFNSRNNTSEQNTFDALYNIKKIQTANDTLNYTQDKTGLITSKNSTSYSYDDIGRLTQAGADTFTYDKAGNNLNSSAVYNLLNNQMQENALYAITYNVMGNIASKYNKLDKEISTYTFNARNQLTQYVQQDENNQTVKTLEFAYDAFGRRISKTEDGVVQKYLYDGDDIVAILDSNNQVIATITHDESIDTPMSITNQNGTFYYHRDHQGSIVALTDSSGQVVESFTYDNHYGTITDHSKDIETNNPYAYTGRELDTTDLYYYRARYYDSTIQRFVGEDPIGFASKDTNWYRYTWNNPVNLVDHNGLYGIKKCSYYRETSKTVNGFTYIYYEYVGYYFCEYFPTQPFLPKWTDCVRLCLQEFDKKNNCKDPCNAYTSTCVIGAHGYCWSKCGSNPDKDPVK